MGLTTGSLLDSLNSIGKPKGLSGSGFGSQFKGESLLPFQDYSSEVATTASPFEPGWFDNLVGWKDSKTGIQHGGWGGLTLGAGSALMNGFMGMKQYGLMQDSLKEQKRQFNTNFDAQKKLVNSQLEDRQRARVASNPGAYESVGDYLDKNRIG